jgi:hypothetical protein
VTIPCDWFRYPDLKHRRFAKAVWIPLRAIEDLRSEKSFGDLGYIKETFACGSLAVPIDHRELGEKLGWSDIGVGHEVGHYCGPEGYKRADEYWLDRSSPAFLGTELILPQHFAREIPAEWHLNQDLVFALRLQREGDVWLARDEGYVEVVRLTRDTDGYPSKIEIRAEHIRDYLAARKMALRIVWYRDRDAIVEDATPFSISDRREEEFEESPGFRWVGRSYAVHEGSGDPIGSQSAVFHAWRTDVDPGEDVPEFGPETDNNVDYTSRTFARSGAEVYRVEGEIWAEEWIEPAEHSPRVRGDDLPSTTSFIVDASGATQSADELDNEDIGKYLWFRPDIIPNLLSRRGAKWQWYSRETGGIELVLGYHVHFGVNSLGLVNAYAYDIAKLPEWQRRIWHGFNVAPDGGVSAELLQSQMQARPAKTLAPERHLAQALGDVDERFRARFGVPLFRVHPSSAEIAAAIHRFRALDQQGVFALAKDISRLIVEAIDTTALHKIAPPEKGAGTGSMRSLERVLATIVSTEEARSALTRIVGIYELRGADAHLPSSELDDGYRLSGIDKSAPPLEQGLQMLLRTMQALGGLHALLDTSASETIGD